MSAAPPTGPHGWIVVHLSGGTFLHHARIDGETVPVSAAPAPVPVSAGSHVVEVWFDHFGAEYGRRSLTVDVAAGATVPVHYTTPRHVYGQAQLGLAPSAPSTKVDGREVRSSLLYAVLAVVLVGLCVCGAALVWAALGG